MRFHHLLVPIDFEESSQRALEMSIELALTFDAKLTVVHAWDVVQYSYGTVYLAPEMNEAVEQAAKQRLASALLSVVKRRPAADSVLVNGPAAFEILGVVERMKVDLVVMGTHGRHGLGRMLLGSVADKIVRASPVPVLTIRASARAEHP
jgi:nucleotide-binding universal stress UspA family protein